MNGVFELTMFLSALEYLQEDAVVPRLSGLIDFSESLVCRSRCCGCGVPNLFTVVPWCMAIPQIPIHPSIVLVHFPSLSREYYASGGVR